jgi:NADH dehydrogenase/NADH:ubiquinone oxidoreductase subunit G
MKDIHLQIDGEEVMAKEGTTILDAARSAGIAIPTLCHHDKLEPFGGCRLCIVEVSTRPVHVAQPPSAVRNQSERVAQPRYPPQAGADVRSGTGVPPVELGRGGQAAGVPQPPAAETRGDSRLVVSCVYTVEDKLVVKTRSKKIDGIRKTILELLLAHAPDSPKLQELAAEYGADRNCFEKEASFCVHCGLCVRYCAEVKKKNAVGFIGRGISKEISFVPKLAAVECETCKECFPLCPTSYLQAAFVLTKSLAFPQNSGDTTHI